MNLTLILAIVAWSVIVLEVIYLAIAAAMYYVKRKDLDIQQGEKSIADRPEKLAYKRSRYK